VTGREWAKSACVYCPFAVSTRRGLGATLDRFAAEPAAGAHALFLEHVALCINDRQGLMGSRRLVDEVTRARLTKVLDQFTERLLAHSHAVYEVRRLARPRGGGSAMIARSVRQIRRGPRDEMLSTLRSMPGRFVTGADGILRSVLRECRVSKFVANADALISTFPLVSSTWRTVLSHFRGESWNHTCVQCLGGRVVTCWPSGRVPGVWPSAGGLSRDRRPGAAW